MKELPPEILFLVFKRFESASTLANCAMVSKTWNKVASDGSLWFPFCAQFWVPVNIIENRNLKDRDRQRFIKWKIYDNSQDPRASFVEWYRKFKDVANVYPKIKSMANSIISWMKRHSTSTYNSLQGGIFEWETLYVDMIPKVSSLNRLNELNVNIQAFILLYHFINGQKARMPHVDHGLFGTFTCYDQFASLFMLPSQYVRSLSINGLGVCAFAVCPRTGKFLAIVCQEGNLLGKVVELNDKTGYLVDHGYFIEFMENHVNSLIHGKCDLVGESKSLSLFKRNGPFYSCQVTRGIEVEVSTNMSIESESREGMWVYRVKLSLVGDVFGPENVPEICQLISRNWIIRYQSGLVEHVRGDAVVGEHPILSRSQPTFAYCSICMGRQRPDRDIDFPLSMEGSFTFINGTMAEANSEREAEYFDVQIAKFNFQLPQKIIDYI